MSDMTNLESIEQKKEEYVVKCFQISTLEDKVYELFKKVVYKQRLIKSQKFVFDIDAKRCVCAGILLQYSFFKSTGSIQMPIILHNNYGKPFINDTKFCYNLTHSGDWVGLAYGRNEVGLDIERVVDERNQLSYSFLTDKEMQFLYDFLGESYKQQLIRLWTIKEAYVKWLGTGLSKEMNSFSVNIDNIEDMVWEGSVNCGVKWISSFLDKAHYFSLCGTGKKFVLDIVKADELEEFAYFLLAVKDIWSEI